MMDENQLNKLARYAQIKITKEESSFFLNSFKNVENMLSSFKKINLENHIDESNNIIDSSLSISDLKEIEKKYKILRITKENLQKNALIEDGKFVFIKKS
jgi:Asp-tRNA(Asn)/Glu-tRNA(Gln) amidotransferase C subunit